MPFNPASQRLLTPGFYMPPFQGLELRGFPRTLALSNEKSKKKPGINVIFFSRSINQLRSA
jgi:hypothetical protein